MAVTRTSEDLVTAALSRIGATEAGQEVSAEDMALGQQRFEEILADLSARRVVYVPDEDAIDLAYFPHLSAYLAVTLLGDFPTDQVTASMLPTLDQSETKLRQIQSTPNHTRTTPATYF